MAPSKKRKVGEASTSALEDAMQPPRLSSSPPLDFSSWALQDLVKAPLRSEMSSSASSAEQPRPRRCLGVQSLVYLATGRNGKVMVCDARKRHIVFELGRVEGYRQQTPIVYPEDAPKAVADLFTVEVAKEVLRTPSFLERLEKAGGDKSALQLVIEEILKQLELFSEAEFEALKKFCISCGTTLPTDGGKLPLRGGRVGTKLVLALIDVVMVAKKCSYEAAKSICHRMLKDYWNLDVASSGRLSGVELTHLVFHSLNLGNAGRPTICAEAEGIAEVLILIPGCELSVQLRKDMIRSFFGIGGNAVTFENLLLNPRIRAHLQGLEENPVGDFLDENERKVMMRELPARLLQRDEELKVGFQQNFVDLQLELRKRDAEREEEFQVLLAKRDEEWRLQLELALAARDERLLSRFVAHSEKYFSQLVSAMQCSMASLLQPLQVSLQPLGELLISLKGLTHNVSMSVRGAVRDVIDAAVTSVDSKLVKAFRKATKRSAEEKKRSVAEEKFKAAEEKKRASEEKKEVAITAAVAKKRARTAS
jgi:hypothetical protein